MPCSNYSWVLLSLQEPHHSSHKRRLFQRRGIWLFRLLLQSPQDKSIPHIIEPNQLHRYQNASTSRPSIMKGGGKIGSSDARTKRKHIYHWDHSYPGPIYFYCQAWNSFPHWEQEDRIPAATKMLTGWSLLPPGLDQQELADRHHSAILPSV